jgi:transcriptional regulator with GAF, ATPase, and Fis domain
MLPRSFRDAVKVFEKQLLEDALGACGGDREAAAKRLRLPVRTLAYTMRRLGIHLRPRPKKGRRGTAA